MQGGGIALPLSPSPIQPGEAEPVIRQVSLKSRFDAPGRITGYQPFAMPMEAIINVI